jgi:quinone-modifying oxidoreductase subunit QmoC
MANSYLVEPDVGFIEEVSRLGGADVKKCFQCATCSVACPISPDTKPFPRKEMIATSWGLKDRLIGSGDVWLCHNCGDCSTLCPRGAQPGDVLAAVRAATVIEYATPKFLAKMVSDPKKLPVLLAIRRRFSWRSDCCSRWWVWTGSISPPAATICGRRIISAITWWTSS